MLPINICSTSINESVRWIYHPGPSTPWRSLDILRVIEQLLRRLRDHLRQVPLHLDAQLLQGHLRQVGVLILGAQGTDANLVVVKQRISKKTSISCS